MFRSLSNLITGFRPDSMMESDMEKATVNGQTVIIVPGIRMEDEKGLECARKNGWIMNYQSLVTLVGQENFFWDLKIAEASEVMFKHFTTAILRLYAERKSAKVSMNKEQREQVVGQLFEQLLGSTGLTQESLSLSGFLVLRYKHEIRTTPKPMVDNAIARYATAGVMPPVIVTHQALELLSREHQLLDLEMDKKDGSIVFMPQVERVTHSTAIGSDLNATCDELADQISEIEFDLDANHGDITSFMEKTIVDMTDPEALAGVLTNLDQTHTKQRALVVAVNNQRAEIDTVKDQIREKFQEQKTEIDELKQIVHEKSNELTAKDAEIDDLQQELDTVKLEYDSQVAKMNNELSVLESKQAEERSKGIQVPIEKLDEAEDTISSLKEDLKKNKNEIRQKMLRLKTEYDGNLKDKEDQVSKLMIEKEAIATELETRQAELSQLATQLNETENENKRLKQRNEDLSERMTRLNHKMKQMSALGKAAKQSTMDISSCPKTSKLKRQQAVDHAEVKMKTSDVLSLLPGSADPSPALANDTAIIAAMTTKEATNIVPRWNPQENIVAYCKKVENAWNICQAENFTEEKFCQLLRLQSPESAAQVFDNMNDDKKKKVSDVKAALLLRLDRQQNEYLQDFANVQKGALENHNAFALRVQRLYVLGTGDGTAITARDKKLIVEAFLKGLPQSEQSALRLVATDSEMLDVDALAKRAARSARTQTTVNAVSDEPKKMPDKQGMTKNRFRGNCFYCKKFGHTWRRCHKRADNDREWKPSEADKKDKPKSA